MRRHVHRDDGFVTVAVVGLSLVLLLVAALVAALAAVAVTRHRAAAAADLGALAAARHALEGAGPACSAAERVVQAQAARLERCELDGLDALIVVAVVPPGRIGQLGTARAQARAGPAR